MLGESSGESFGTSCNYLPNCVSCTFSITDQSYLIKTVCGHYFHKSCFHKCVKSNPNCPQCKNRLVVSNPIIPSTPVQNPLSLPPAMGTRAQTQRAINFDANRSALHLLRMSYQHSKLIYQQLPSHLTIEVNN